MTGSKNLQRKQFSKLSDHERASQEKDTSNRKLGHTTPAEDQQKLIINNFEVNIRTNIFLHMVKGLSTIDNFATIHSLTDGQDSIAFLYKQKSASLSQKGYPANSYLGPVITSTIDKLMSNSEDNFQILTHLKM